jgi:hypothetical protein
MFLRLLEGLSAFCFILLASLLIGLLRSAKASSLETEEREHKNRLKR